MLHNRDSVRRIASSNINVQNLITHQQLIPQTSITKGEKKEKKRLFLLSIHFLLLIQFTWGWLGGQSLSQQSQPGYTLDRPPVCRRANRETDISLRNKSIRNYCKLTTTVYMTMCFCSFIPFFQDAAESFCESSLYRPHKKANVVSAIIWLK